MKKIIIVGLLSLSLLAVGASMAFADSGLRGNEEGEQIKNLEISPEERMELKLLKIDELVELERLTREEAVEFKEVVTERMSNCDGERSGRMMNEMMGVGFGRRSEMGNGQGNGFQRGR